MKLYFEIAVDQQTRAVTKLLRWFRTPGAHRCPRDSHAHIWSICGPVLPNDLNKRKLWNLAAKFFEDLNQISAFYNKGFFLFLSDSESFMQNYLKMAEK